MVHFTFNFLSSSAAIINSLTAEPIPINAIPVPFSIISDWPITYSLNGTCQFLITPFSSWITYYHWHIFC